MNEQQQKLTADLLEWAGTFAAGFATMFGGAPGVMAATAVKTITNTAAQVMRLRGATVDDVVNSLNQIDPLNTPWKKTKGNSKDPPR